MQCYDVLFVPCGVFLPLVMLWSNVFTSESYFVGKGKYIKNNCWASSYIFRSYVYHVHHLSLLISTKHTAETDANVSSFLNKPIHMVVVVLSLPQSDLTEDSSPGLCFLSLTDSKRAFTINGCDTVFTCFVWPWVIILDLLSDVFLTAAAFQMK